MSAYAAKNSVAPSDIAGLIASVHQSLAATGQKPKAAASEPTVPIKKSVTANYVVCLEDGKRQKMLRRHLAVAHGLTPAEYRSRWGLAADHPLVAPNYAKQRSEMAKKIGLGKKRSARKPRKKR